jgi:NAD(P)-dependent dehydrogenase (short-subunit alcohol dehydrogenase family)
MAAPFAGKAIIVTGGFSGIGWATVRRLLDLSAVVHAVDWAAAAPTDIPQGEVYFYPSVDVSSRAAVTAAFQTIFQRSPDVYGLVNCAGISPASTGLINDDKYFEHVMGVNCTGTWNTGTEFLRYVQTRHEGPSPLPGTSIVNIGSTASLRGYATYAPYVCSKHAVLGLTRAWALDFAAMGVRVNLVAPGGTRTPMFERQMADAGGKAETAALATAGIPMKRIGESPEIAEAIVFLLGGGASFITGQVIPVNGGEF